MLKDFCLFVAPVPPKGLRLETQISYNILVPMEQQDGFKEEVMSQLQPTECVTSDVTKCNVYLNLSSTSSTSGSVISTLKITFQILLESDIRKLHIRMFRVMREAGKTFLLNHM